MSEEELRAIEERADKATPGPWKWRRCYELDGLHWAIENPESHAERCVIDYTLVLAHNQKDSMVYKPADSNPNWQFIAHARTDIPKLIAEIRRLRALTTLPQMPTEKINAMGEKP